jgi:steroid 5-alpha reductase family enzyme
MILYWIVVCYNWLMVGRLLLINAIGLVVYMTVFFLVARARKRLDTVDTAWGGGFVVASVLVAGQTHYGRNILIAALIEVWAIRLTSHIVERSKKRKEDPRYEAIAGKWKGNYWLRAYFSIFLLQGVIIWIVSLPTVFAANPNLVKPAAVFIMLGAIVWAKGFIFEFFADRQLAQFISNPKNKGKLLDTGLWRYSRHPNYYGEIVQWIGIGIIACSARYGWVGLIGPLVLALTIVFISGIPPIENRKKTDKKYQEYTKHTSVLIPWFKH